MRIEDVELTHILTLIPSLLIPKIKRFKLRTVGDILAIDPYDFLQQPSIGRGSVQALVSLQRKLTEKPDRFIAVAERASMVLERKRMREQNSRHALTPVKEVNPEKELNIERVLALAQERELERAREQERQLDRERLRELDRERLRERERELALKHVNRIRVLPEDRNMDGSLASLAAACLVQMVDLLKEHNVPFERNFLLLQYLYGIRCEAISEAAAAVRFGTIPEKVRQLRSKQLAKLKRFFSGAIAHSPDRRCHTELCFRMAQFSEQLEQYSVLPRLQAWEFAVSSRSVPMGSDQVASLELLLHVFGYKSVQYKGATLFLKEGVLTASTLEHTIKRIGNILLKSDEPMSVIQILDALKKRRHDIDLSTADIDTLLRGVQRFERTQHNGQLCYRHSAEQGERTGRKATQQEHPTERWLRPVRLASAERECSLLERGASLRDDEAM